MGKFGLIRIMLVPLRRICGVLTVVRSGILCSRFVTIWARVSWTCLSLLALSVAMILLCVIRSGVTTDWTCELIGDVRLLGRRLSLFTTPPNRMLALLSTILE